MQSKALTLTLLVSGLSLVAVPAKGEIELQSVQWQLTQREPGKALRPPVAENISELVLAPGGKLSGSLRAKVKMLNRGPALEAILVRYAVSAKLAPLDKRSEGVWALPFFLSDRRIPRASANTPLELPLDPTSDVAIYLKNVFREGYWPEELKIEIMVQPRRDQKTAIKILESSLPLKADKP